MKLNFIIETKHSRKIDNDDLYFIVSVKNENIITEVGWIEKSFEKIDFEKQTGLIYVSHKEFKTKEDYDKSKYNK